MHKLCDLQSTLNILFDIIKSYLKIWIDCVWIAFIWILSRSEAVLLNTEKNIRTVYNKQIRDLQSLPGPLKGESGVFCMVSTLGT